MHDANFAERILELFTERERAATIVGDLAETAQARGRVWFWRSVASTAIGLGWRYAALFVACMAMQSAVGAAMFAIVDALSDETRSGPIGPLLGLSAMLPSALTLYAAFRYGVRDPLTRLVGAITLIAFLGGCLLRTPFAPQAAFAGVLGLMIAAVVSRDGRRALWATVITFVASAVVFTAIVILNSWRHVVFFPLNAVMIIAVQWWVCSRVRRSVPA